MRCGSGFALDARVVEARIEIIVPEIFALDSIEI